MYVNDGFTHDDDTMHEPSVTNTFGASHTWLKRLSTDVRRIVTHARRAHLVNAHAHGVASIVRRDAADTGGFEQLGHVVHHVFAHQPLVLARLAIDREHRQAPLVLLHLVERHLIVVARQDLAERRRADLPRAGFCGAVLERHRRYRARATARCQPARLALPW